MFEIFNMQFFLQIKHCFHYVRAYVRLCWWRLVDKVTTGAHRTTRMSAPRQLTSAANTSCTGSPCPVRTKTTRYEGSVDRYLPVTRR